MGRGAFGSRATRRGANAGRPTALEFPGKPGKNQNKYEIDTRRRGMHVDEGTEPLLNAVRLSLSYFPMATKKAPKKSVKESPKPKEGPKAKGAAAPAAPAKKDDGAKRKLGLRGAAPWAMRHAAKHAAEARARAAEPPLPGSARATIRTPNDAEERKAKIAELHTAMTQIRGFRKNLNKTFWDVGGILREIQIKKLYEPRGFATFEAFLEREMDFGKTTSLRLVKIHAIFQKEAAVEHGMERVMNALLMLDTPVDGASKSDAKVPPAPISTSALPLKPPGR